MQQINLCNGFDTIHTSTTYKSVLLTPLLCDYSTYYKAIAPSSSSSSSCFSSSSSLNIDPNRINLETLWKVKQYPTASKASLNMGNVDECIQELQKSLIIKSNAIIISGNSTTLLQTIQNISNKTKASIIISTSPNLSTTPQQQIEDANRMRSELLVGVGVLTKGVNVLPKAGVICCQLGSPFNKNSSNILSKNDESLLISCALVHSTIREADFNPSSSSLLSLIKVDDSDMKLSSSSSSSSTTILNANLPPIVISAGLLSTQHEDIAFILAINGCDVSKCIFNQLACESYQIEDFINRMDNLIGRFSCMISLDSFGYSSIYNPIDFQYASDDELIYILFELCKRGHAANIHLSINIITKLQYSKYGGHSFNYINEIIISKIKSYPLKNNNVENLPNEMIQGFLSTHIVKLLTWYIPPASVALSVDTKQCFLCSEIFPCKGYDHYSKFDFVYCSSLCLEKHRDKNFVKNIV